MEQAITKQENEHESRGSDLHGVSGMVVDFLPSSSGRQVKWKFGHYQFGPDSPL